MPNARDVSRLKNFSDAVFALSATLLVVTLEVPNSYAALTEAVAGFPAFALSFAAIISLWHNHREFFAHYPLDDNRTVILNSILLFIILLYVYPLKLLTQLIVERFFGAEATIIAEMTPGEVQGLYFIFAIAAFGVFAVFALLHAHAWHARAQFNLDESGQRRLRHELYSYSVLVGLSLASIGATLLSLGLSWGLPIWLFLLSPIFEVLRWQLYGKKQAQKPDAASEDA